MNQNFKLIDRYFSGDLSELEKKQVEERLTQDKNLKSEYIAYRHSKNAIENIIGQNLRKDLKALQANGGKLQSIPSARNPRIIALRILAYAAGVALIMGFGTFFWFNHQYDAAQLADKYYQAEKPSSFRSNNREIDPELYHGLDLIKTKKYTAASAYFEDLSKRRDYADIAQYYLGNLLYLQHKYPEAQEKFTALFDSTLNPNLKDKAEWLAFLSCINQKPLKDICKNNLQSISSNPNHSYHQSAIRLNKTLNSWMGKLAN